MGKLLPEGLDDNKVDLAPVQQEFMDEPYNKDQVVSGYRIPQVIPGTAIPVGPNAEDLTPEQIEFLNSTDKGKPTVLQVDSDIKVQNMHSVEVADDSEVISMDTAQRIDFNPERVEMSPPERINYESFTKGDTDNRKTKPPMTVRRKKNRKRSKVSKASRRKNR